MSERKPGHKGPRLVCSIILGVSPGKTGSSFLCVDPNCDDRCINDHPRELTRKEPRP